MSIGWTFWKFTFIHQIQGDHIADSDLIMMTYDLGHRYVAPISLQNHFIVVLIVTRCVAGSRLNSMSWVYFPLTHRIFSRVKFTASHKANTARVVRGKVYDAQMSSLSILIDLP